ncbi:hypothetical protein GYMLUDRAFT_78067 [Collybiopsis luxurians FD-317 M1]|uniref:Unplaced genomic scaffold GYMLUscaffold_108, whole genome shotgun sequence n=1 Tax=Collybiopsis luxurians FD-317 M1 TaxID=944289 RepID=A0A0D0C1R2_9AGAR|nr:hypothetical protein GYMLUDRAFT_78067 [Collybiopsis luxurians FD-317 M1]
MSWTDIRIATNGRQCNYWHMAAITLLFYDHILTFKTEIKCLWKRQSNISAHLFFLHRYFNPITMIITFVTLFDNLPVSCKALSNLREGILIVAQLIVTIIMTLRVYALYGCSKRMLYFLLAVIAVLFTIAVIMTFTVHTNSPVSPPSTGGCSTQLDFDRVYHAGAAVAWMTIFSYDALLFGLAVYNAFITRQELRMIKSLKVRVSLRVILLRDGDVMTAINLANILSFYDCMRGGLAPITSSISVTLVSRLMLNLHQVMSTGIYLSRTVSVLETVETGIAFQRRNSTSVGDNYNDNDV